MILDCDSSRICPWFVEFRIALVDADPFTRQNQHKHFNGLLNQRVEASDPTESRTRIRYAHTREVDTFHSLGENRKARVTRDQANGQVQRIVEKTRVADMNITSPKRLFDWRISVSLENQGSASRFSLDRLEG